MADDNFDASADARDGTIELVSAFASNPNNRLSTDDFQALIRDTFATLSSLSGPSATTVEPEVEDQTRTKTEIRKSIGATHLTSFVDGRPYKSLKRHLGTHGMTPQDYRAKFGLGNDYPMVHPEYAKARSELAKAIGLGSKGRMAKASPKPAAKPRKAKEAATAE